MKANNKAQKEKTEVAASVRRAASYELTDAENRDLVKLIAQGKLSMPALPSDYLTARMR